MVLNHDQRTAISAPWRLGSAGRTLNANPVFSAAVGRVWVRFRVRWSGLGPVSRSLVGIGSDLYVVGRGRVRDTWTLLLRRREARHRLAHGIDPEGAAGRRQPEPH